MISSIQGKALLIMTTLFVVSVFTGYYLYNEVKRDNKSLEAELASNSNNLNVLQEEIASLRIASETLNTSLKSSTDMIENLQLELYEIRANYSNIVHDYRILDGNFSSLLASHASLEATFQDLYNNYIEMEAAYNETQSEYDRLVQLINTTIINDFTQTISFNVTPGASKIWEFLIPEFGIVWEASLSFTGVRVSMGHHWRREGERVFVGSSGISLMMEGYEEYPYYGPQEFLWGNVTVSWSFDSHDRNFIWVTGSIVTNLPTIRRGGGDRIEI